MELSKHNADAALEIKKSTVLNSGWSAVMNTGNTQTQKP